MRRVTIFAQGYGTCSGLWDLHRVIGRHEGKETCTGSVNLQLEHQTGSNLNESYNA